MKRIKHIMEQMMQQDLNAQLTNVAVYERIGTIECMTVELKEIYNDTVLEDVYYYGMSTTTECEYGIAYLVKYNFKQKINYVSCIACDLTMETQLNFLQACITDMRINSEIRNALIMYLENIYLD